MVTSKVQLALPHKFVDVQVTVVVPVAKVLPDAGVQTTVPVGVPFAVGSVHVAT